MRILVATAALACSAAFWSVPAQAQGYYVEQRPPVYVRPPPPPRHEAEAPHRRGHIWVPGHWEWRGRGHTWVPGHYLAVRSGYYYEQPRWEQHGDRWSYRSGRWARGRGDRDRDGVPDRHDRDRDGDGIRNRYDRAPDNPYRR